MADPLCFVLMPFGDKPDGSGKIIKFDEVYDKIIKPAIKGAGLNPIRADEELTRGIIHKPMYERLILCDFAVADLTTANANVFYELGIRHAVRPGSTVLMFVKEGRLPFDVAGLRSLPYDIDANGSPANPDAARAALEKQLEYVRENRDEDSPVFELLKPFPSLIEHLKTHTLQDIKDATRQEEEIREAKTTADLKTFQTNLGALDGVESGVLLKLFLAYRKVKDWQAMIDLVAEMPEPLARTVTVREQLAFALNRVGKSEEAENVVTTLIAERGGSSETYGILGRIYKDRFAKALEAQDEFLTPGLLDQAMEAYLKGFEADWRDAFPGINAVTLMELKEPPDERRHDVFPVVHYAALRRASSPQANYWDFATLLELAVLGKNEAEAKSMTGKALTKVQEKWEPETTLNNLNLIHTVRQRRGEEEPPWIANVMNALARAAQ